MISGMGYYAIIVAMVFALVQAIVPMIGVARSNEAMMKLAQSTAIGQLIFVSIAFVVLMLAFAQNDFSLLYVWQNSNRQLPLIYRLCAVWGAHEGSLLLWVYILTIWAAVVALCSRHLPLPVLSRVLAILAMLALGFYGFLLSSSDPFTLLPSVPENGRDLNPILQDPGLILHPPMLYMGYVGFSVAFAFAIAALIEGRFDRDWARWSRPWTIIAWCFLTLGIVLGSWWAYRELGWGGVWFWDPVENASLLPWLAGTALLHSLMVTQKQDRFRAWTVLLAVLTFSLSLFGTFIVRSGVLISVHAFAQDPARGFYVLLFLGTVIGSSLTLYAWRGRELISHATSNIHSREILLLMNNVILLVAMATVLLGTLYPLVISVLGLGKLSVGAPYFNLVFIPLMIPLLFLMGLAPLSRWEKIHWRPLVAKNFILFAITILLAIIFLLSLHEPFRWSACLGLTLAFWVILQTLMRRRWKYLLAHLGMGVVVIGFVLSAVYSQSRTVSMVKGDDVSVGPYQFQLKSVSRVQGPNYQGLQATLQITQHHHFITQLHPQLRVFLADKIAIAKTAIDVGALRDLYVALGAPLGQGAWAVRIYYKPFVRWIWAGGLLMVIGGVLALGRRHC